MSRFGDARWQRVAAWSGAALAWGSTVTAVVLEPARDAPSVPASQVEVSTTQAPLPAQPGSGLLVIRYQPDAVEVIQTVASPPAPAAAAPAAPQPKSSGS
ncbi:MAG: hypothetical protein WD274_04530 [Acidimicrobiia bacterium]